MTTTLLALAAIGWLTSVAGAVGGHVAAFRLVESETAGLYDMRHRPRIANLALVLVVAGATVGALGTILGVLVTDG